MCNDHDRPVQTKNDDYGLQARGLKRKNKEHCFQMREMKNRQQTLTKIYFP